MSWQLCISILASITSAFAGEQPFRWKLERAWSIGPNSVYENFHPVTERSPLMTQPRSKWGRQADVVKLNEGFERMQFHHAPKAYVYVFKGSLGEANPQLIHILSDIYYYQMSTSRFQSQIRLTPYPRLTREGVLAFYLQRKRIFEDGVGKVSRLIMRDNAVLGASVMKAVDRWIAKHQKFYERLRHIESSSLRVLRLDTEQQRLRKMFEICDDLNHQMSGFLGELYVAVSVPGAIGQSVYVDEFPQIANAITKQFASIRPQIIKSPGILEKYEKKYPELFWEPVKDFPFSEGIEERLVRIEHFMKSLEFDVVVKAGEHMILIEEKVRKDILTGDAFNSAMSNHKTLSQQLHRYRELLDFASADGEPLPFKIGYSASNGIEASLQKTLEAEGVIIIPNVPDCDLALQPRKSN